jgi:hypothetical protein
LLGRLLLPGAELLYRFGDYLWVVKDVVANAPIELVGRDVLPDSQCLIVRAKAGVEGEPSGCRTDYHKEKKAPTQDLPALSWFHHLKGISIAS